MTPSTREIASEIDAAIAALDAQLARSAETIARLAATTEHKTTATRLARVANALRESASH